MWTEHASKPFPRALAGEEFDGKDLALLDSTTAGCISTFLGTGSLDADRLAMLDACVQSLSRVCPELPDENRDFFVTLQEIAERVVTFCRGRS
jgi:hypothetical protein